MITYKKIETYEELDEILPMVESLHKTQKFCSFPHSAYLLWLTLTFRTPSMGIWVCYEDDMHGMPVGYIIVTLEDIHTVREALIYEAYSQFKHVDIKKLLLVEITEWAKANSARRLSLYTENGKVMDTMISRYGFELFRFHLVKEI